MLEPDYDPAEDPSFWEDEASEDLDDDFDPDCSLFFDSSGRVWTCGQIGSEFCDFSCPQRHQIGRSK